MKNPPLWVFCLPPTLPMTHLASCLTLTGRPVDWNKWSLSLLSFHATKWPTAGGIPTCRMLSSWSKESFELFVAEFWWHISDCYCYKEHFWQCAVNIMENALAMVTANTHPRLMLPMFLEADDALFGKILHDKAHVLHSFLPDRPDIVYSLRARSHSLSLSCVKPVTSTNATF